MFFCVWLISLQVHPCCSTCQNFPSHFFKLNLSGCLRCSPELALFPSMVHVEKEHDWCTHTCTSVSCWATFFLVIQGLPWQPSWWTDDQITSAKVHEDWDNIYGRKQCHNFFLSTKWLWHGSYTSFLVSSALLWSRHGTRSWIHGEHKGRWCPWSPQSAGGQTLIQQLQTQLKKKDIIHGAHSLRGDTH